MAAQKKLFSRLMWLIETIYSAGKISLEEIDRRWSLAVYINDGEAEYGSRNFYRHRIMIKDLFNIDITCNRYSHDYSIESLDATENSLQSLLINAFAINNVRNIAGEVRDRIVFENIPAGSRYISPIITAMKSSHKLMVTYQKFESPEPHSFLLTPYFMKLFRQRWYLIGKPEDHPEESDPRTYSLDRIKELCLTDETFSIPKDFDVQNFFSNHFGIDRSIPNAERIRIKVTKTSADYLRSLTLHDSQFEIERTDDYSVFGFFVAPTFDFIQELRKLGPDLEVLEPEHLRLRFKYDLMESLSKYNT